MILSEFGEFRRGWNKELSEFGENVFDEDRMQIDRRRTERGRLRRPPVREFLVFKARK